MYSAQQLNAYTVAAASTVNSMADNSVFYPSGSYSIPIPAPMYAPNYSQRTYQIPAPVAAPGMGGYAVTYRPASPYQYPTTAPNNPYNGYQYQMPQAPQPDMQKDSQIRELQNQLAILRGAMQEQQRQFERMNADREIERQQRQAMFAPEEQKVLRRIELSD